MRHDLKRETANSVSHDLPPAKVLNDYSVSEAYDRNYDRKPPDPYEFWVFVNFRARSGDERGRGLRSAGLRGADLSGECANICAGTSTEFLHEAPAHFVVMGQRPR